MVLLDTPLFHRCWEEVSLLGVPVPFEERRKEGLRGQGGRVPLLTMSNLFAPLELETSSLR